MQPISTLLAKHLKRIDDEIDNEPYTLTPEEESKILSHELEQAKKHLAWKLTDKGLSVEESLLRISQVDWDKEIDKTQILKLANSNKNYELWQQEQRKKEQEDAAKKLLELKDAWTARTMLKLMRWTSEVEFGKTLIENENTLPLIKAVCFFLSADSRFETELGYSLQKGLLIRGISGLGKTHTIRCVAKNDLNPIHIVSLLEITDDIRSKGEYEMPKGRYTKIYLDDVGTEEPTVKFYGSNISWLKDFLETYYLRSNQYNRLILSTNNNHAELEKIYGFRVRSRIKDMFNVIDVDGKDLRGL